MRVGPIIHITGGSHVHWTLTTGESFVAPISAFVAAGRDVDQLPAWLISQPTPEQDQSAREIHSAWLLKDHKDRIVWGWRYCHQSETLNKHHSAERRKGHTFRIGREGQTLREAIAHEGDSEYIGAVWPDLIIVHRPASRGPLRPEMVPGIQYAVMVADDGWVYAYPAHDPYAEQRRRVQALRP